MKYVKMLGLLAIAAAALMAFAGTASATKLTSPAGTKLGVGTVIKSASEGTTSLDGSVDVACAKSTVEGSITNDGLIVDKNEKGEVVAETTQSSVTGSISTLTFTECGKDTVTVSSGGSLSISGSNAVTSTGAEVTVQLHRSVLGFPITTHCIYKTNNTNVGNLTESSARGGATATLDIDSALIPQTATDGACGSNAEWTGSYIVNTPDYLDVD